MLPALRTLGDGAVWKSRQLTARLADEFSLTSEDRTQQLSSGALVITNRVAWALAHLKSAGLIQNVSRGEYAITPSGMALLAEKPEKINNRTLFRYPSYQSFRRPKAASGSDIETRETAVIDATPTEELSNAYLEIHQALVAELLGRLKSCSPQFFEKAVVDLLLAMGYGGIDKRGEVTNYVADGGIDGIIHEDRLGLDLVCVQAKRYAEHSIGRPIVQAFVGSMDFHKAKKGVMLTTSQFSQPAIDFLRHIENKRVVLIGGDQLAEYMIHYGVGVKVKETYKICEISEDFFEQDEF